MFIITEQWGLCPVVKFKKPNLLLFNMYRHLRLADVWQFFLTQIEWLIN